MSRGKTTPTLHFLCLHGSHAIDAVSIPSSLMLLPTFESSLCIGAPAGQLVTEMDGRKLPAVNEVRDARDSALRSKRRTLTLRTFGDQSYAMAGAPGFDLKTRRRTREKGSSRPKSKRPVIYQPRLHVFLFFSFFFKKKNGDSRLQNRRVHRYIASTKPFENIHTQHLYT